MIFRSGNDQRTTHFALTSPSHHQSGLGVVVSTFLKTKQWVVVSSSFLPATFSSMHTALQSLTKVAHFSLRARGFSVCRSTQLQLAQRTRRTAEVVWGADWAALTSLPLAGSLQAEPLLQRTLVPSVLCELTLPAVLTPPLPERGGGRPAELKVVTRTPEDRDEPFSMHNATRRAATSAKDGTSQRYP